MKCRRSLTCIASNTEQYQATQNTIRCGETFETAHLFAGRHCKLLSRTPLAFKTFYMQTEKTVMHLLRRHRDLDRSISLRTMFKWGLVNACCWYPLEMRGEFRSADTARVLSQLSLIKCHGCVKCFNKNTAHWY